LSNSNHQEDLSCGKFLIQFFEDRYSAVVAESGQAGLNGLESNPLIGRVVRGPEVAMNSSVTHTADIVKCLADVTVQETFPVKSTQSVDLPVTLNANPAPLNKVTGENLAELPGLEDRNAWVGKHRCFRSGSVQDEQRFMWQQEPEVRRRPGEFPDPLVHQAPHSRSPPECCTLSQSHT